MNVWVRGEGILRSGEEIAEWGKGVSKAWPRGSSENHLQMDPLMQRRGNRSMNRPMWLQIFSVG